jgi:hypothetical protein
MEEWQAIEKASHPNGGDQPMWATQKTKLEKERENG